MIKTPRLVPALIAFPDGAARAEAWGRLLELSPRRVSLLTRASLEAGADVFLSFEVAGEAFQSLPASVARSRRDEDGYCEAHLEFSDELEKRRLARLLLELGA